MGKSNNSEGGWMWITTIAILICLILVSLCSCSRKVYLPVEHTVYKTDTLRQNTLRVDSIFVRDSISLTQHGDTIFIEKFRDRFRYINLTDTVYQSHTDSVAVKEPYPVEVVKEVPKPLAWWQKTLMWLGVAFFAILIFNAYILFRKK